MAPQPALSADPAFLGHVAVFALAALACFASVPRASRIQDPDTRHGLVALLLASGGWATAHVGFLLAPGVGIKTAFYMAGLIVGFAAVGPWLYFCSAYTGRSLHRDRTVLRVAGAVFLAIVLVKLTNPVHGLYFSTTVEASPFPHVGVEHGVLHWLVMGLSYSLAVVGYFMLFELFAQVSADTKPLIGLATLTGVPILLDVVGLATPYLVDITYEPLGVAAFAVGVLFVYVDRFEAVQLAAGRDEPVVVLSDDDLVRDFNDAARERFPELAERDAIGRPIGEVLPRLTDALDSDASILEVEREGGTRFYRVSENPFATGRTRLGRMITVADVTEREQYRRELERQNERLEQFASMVSHDLRNPLTVAMAQVRIAREDHEVEELEKAGGALERMQNLVEDLLALARTGQPIDGEEPVALTDLAHDCFDLVDAPEASLEVERNARFLADPDRLRQLLENLFRNTVDHGRPDVTITVGPIEDPGDGDEDGTLVGFYVEDDGPGIPEEDREEVFESGYSTADDGTGFGLAIVAEIVEAHGWEIAATESTSGGARFEIRGVEPVE